VQHAAAQTILPFGKQNVFVRRVITPIDVVREQFYQCWPQLGLTAAHASSVRINNSTILWFLTRGKMARLRAGNILGARCKKSSLL
jgi:hypothetical protein